MQWHHGRRSAAAALFVLLLTLGPAAGASAQVTPPGVSEAGREDVGEAAPRGAMREYLSLARRGDYEAASRYLDLSAIPATERAERGARAARELHVVLDRTLWIDLETLSDRPEGLEDDGLPPGRDRLGTVRARGGPADILLARVPAAGGGLVWRVSASSVKRIPELYAQYGYPAFVDRLPRELADWRVLGTYLWQWVGLLAIALAAWAFAFFVAWGGMRLVRLLARRTTTDLDDRLAEALHPPLRLTATLYLFLAGSYWLRLSVPVQAFLVSVSRGLTILLVTWVFLRLVDILTGAARERMVREERRAAVSMLDLGCRVAKVLIVALGLLGLLQNLGFNVSGIMAGLGLGGVALAFAAQKTVENLFGGVSLSLDQPIRVGDFCRYGTGMGTVEDVGLRSTRIRTLERTVVSVPNGQLAAIELENFADRDRFRLFTTIGVRYETSPDQIRRLVGRIRESLAAHPKVVQDPLRVRFVGFGPSSLDIEIHTYVGTRDVEEFHAVREELFLGIMDLVAESGTGFAFPSQTLYLGRDGGLDRERSAAAGREVAAARSPQTSAPPPAGS
jgi:MscS family membrane protein